MSVVMFLHGTALAQEQCATDTGEKCRFYQKSRQGWFWYEDPPPEQQEKPQKPKRELPSLEQYTTRELWTMYPDDFQELLKVIQKKAVQQPSEKNITDYLTMQDIARRKALAYTSATMYVTQKQSGRFGVNSVYPTTRPGISARVTMQQQETARTIAGAAADHALIFFMQQGCGFCEKQAAILHYFQEKYGWPVKRVDIGGSREGQLAAARFNITVTPTLLLVKRGQEQSMKVSTGVVALSELERKLYRAIRVVDGRSSPSDFLRYDFQKGSGLDPEAVLRKE